MLAAVASSWALFLGIALIMLGNGLQNSLLGIRAEVEGFPTAITGLIMTCYFTGFLSGSTIVPKLVERVGHIRTFAALASLASTAILMHALYVEPTSWGAMRLITGFCYAGMYVVAESWLNDRATNEMRGSLLSVYMVVMLGGMAVGQLLLNLADPSGYELFVLTSILISLALVPMLLTAGAAPQLEAPDTMGPRRLYRISPLGTLGALGVGVAQGGLMGMGAVYGKSAGMTVGEVSVFMAAVVFGGVLLQWPIGRISDKLDRRQVLTVITLLAAVCIVTAGVMSANSPPAWIILTLVALFGGLCFPMYSVAIAHTNDFLDQRQMVAASGTLVLIGGSGAIMGPITLAASMSIFGPLGFFWGLGAVHTTIGVFALYRMTVRQSLPVEDQGTLVPVAQIASPVAVTLVEETDETEATPR